MNRKYIQHIVNKHYRKLKKLLKPLTGNDNAEAIHEFRVEYKKFRAFLRMLSMGQKKSEQVKMHKVIKRAYHISGSIRDLQLQKRRILDTAKQQQLKKPRAYLDLLRKEIKKQATSLDDIISKISYPKVKKRTDAALPDQLPVWRIRNYVKQKWAGIHAIVLSRRFSNSNVHHIRKSLKDLFYNIESYKRIKNIGGDTITWQRKDKKNIDALLDELGNFQDKNAGIALLKPSLLSRLHTNNRAVPALIKKEWIREKARMKKLLTGKLTTLNFPLHTSQ